MAHEAPTLTADGHVVFSSSAELQGALPALRSGNLVVRAAGLTRGQHLTVQLAGGGITVKVQTRATVVSEMGDRVLLHLMDLSPSLINAALHPTREFAATGTPSVEPDEALEKARVMLAEAAERMARISRVMKEPGTTAGTETVTTTGGQPIMVRTPVSTPVVTPEASSRVLVHPTGHIEFQNPADLVERAERIARNASISAEWAGHGDATWLNRVFLLCAQHHPAVVDVVGELVPVSGTRCTVMFRDRQELSLAMQGLKQALAMRIPPSTERAELASLDGALCLEFKSVSAVMAALPTLFGLGRLRARWSEDDAPPQGMQTIELSLPPLPERGLIHASVGPARDGIVDVTLDARENVRLQLNTWLSEVRHHTSPRIPVVNP